MPRLTTRALTRCLLATLALLCIALPALAAAPITPLRVMSFNVRVPVDTDGDKRWQARRSAMVSVIKQTHPDVFGTQELVSEQAGYLTAQLPNYRWFGQGRRGDDSDEHMGVFYDARALNVVESGNFWLSDTPEVAGSITWGNVLPRMVTWALFERRSDKRRFYLFNTHFPYRDEDEPARERSARLILSRIAQLPADIPVVLTGDFNSDPDKITYPTLTAVLGDARAKAPKRSGPENTFQDFSTHPTRRIDWILFRGLTPTQFTTLDDRPGGVLPSDHYPVLAEFAWPR
ncbi:endonuclease/exonuclease/phosphatase family protein [Xanthomonas campestris]|uniref:endonuclease/exonuclease/phosphatase family protein n=1 Tax=Xanthomonas campestris TaxID=339 RepID=UPI0008A18547|nr:endonuclease/exonuclease/phosphatase family protein [Xanthomonas campestris]MEB1152150.1 endonuclease/exonuclease/phosphatase family protein [Xanthomonas campestris pv. campestris]MCC5096161.1 endonuclease/exonuclease/phosphatase family protein [Xanthomonas campestris]MEA9581913.1 endonuclease/exonuclease/phosphatase family protein [Xanthomonas campestris]MEA9590152.1 endonuclease/exonuclease/phosphatase family protein [Xanthomonas campestris]MEA9621810.1 endonuclease/exonuclease/phosphatas